ncbi:hypothetical protein [Fimbriiglobus ruber]|uniref:Uncharacterized protein n=1 Tax=Fimbriiglobus ruber TaxID=1908690 RepID=A0A225DWI7_9BACT|nr:hypothetical protein [Fimbriiglobus ruber]OWK42026.1 hypothetical protein FRUB_04104 [Fimbriiglobus ruber]
MPDGDEEKKADESETYLGHPVRKCPPAYAEGVDRGPSVKPRGRKRQKE